MLLALALFAQALLQPMQGYLLSDAALPDADGPPAAVVDRLATPYGRFSLTIGHNCDWLAPAINVEVWRVDGLPDQAVLAPLDEQGQPATATTTGSVVESQLCSVAIVPLDGPPCATNADSVCDVAAEGS